MKISNYGINLRDIDFNIVLDIAEIECLCHEASLGVAASTEVVEI